MTAHASELDGEFMNTLEKISLCCSTAMECINEIKRHANVDVPASTDRARKLCNSLLSIADSIMHNTQELAAGIPLYEKQQPPPMNVRYVNQPYPLPQQQHMAYMHPNAPGTTVFIPIGAMPPNMFVMDTPPMDTPYTLMPMDTRQPSNQGLVMHMQTTSTRRKRSRTGQPPGRCHHCNTSETPEWRYGPDGARTLCNACGLHYAKMQRKRQAAQKAQDTAAQTAASTLASLNKDSVNDV
jgi:hypothetical protein